MDFAIEKYTRKKTVFSDEPVSPEGRPPGHWKPGKEMDKGDERLGNY